MKATKTEIIRLARLAQKDIASGRVSKNAQMLAVQPRLSGLILVDEAHGMDSSVFLRFADVRDTGRNPRHAASE